MVVAETNLAIGHAEHDCPTRDKNKFQQGFLFHGRQFIPGGEDGQSSPTRTFIARVDTKWRFSHRPERVHVTSAIAKLDGMELRALSTWVCSNPLQPPDLLIGRYKLESAVSDARRKAIANEGSVCLGTTKSKLQCRQGRRLHGHRMPRPVSGC